MILEVLDLATAYGLSQVIHGISLGVEAGEIVCLLGRNGAGKTTTLRSIMGLTPPRSGRVTFKGEEITGCQPFEVARLGIGYVPDDRERSARYSAAPRRMPGDAGSGRSLLRRSLSARATASTSCDDPVIRNGSAVGLQGRVDRTPKSVPGCPRSPERG